MSVARASIIMIAPLVASRVLGWLRLSVIGATFGQSPQLDAFWAAFRIPNAVFDLLVAGALASAFIPVFTGYLAREREEEGWRVASSVLNAVVLLLVAFSAVMWLLAPILVPVVVAPGFSGDQLALTVDLTRLMLLSPIFMGLSSLTTGILNSYRQFLSGATAPLACPRDRSPRSRTRSSSCCCRSASSRSRSRRRSFPRSRTTRHSGR